MDSFNIWQKGNSWELSFNTGTITVMLINVSLKKKIKLPWTL